MVETSRNGGTLCRTKGSSVSSPAQRMGRAAFFAPDIRTVPLRAWPPLNLKTIHPEALGCRLPGPLGRREGLHGQGMDLLPHAITKRQINQLMSCNQALALEGGADNDRLKMVPITVHGNVLTGQALADVLLDVLWSDHGAILRRPLERSFERPVQAGQAQWSWPETRW